METKEVKNITIISNVNFALFKGLSQKDLTVDNPAEHNRLNIRPTWSHGLDEAGRIQRFDFIVGDNSCPEYITEWESFQKMCDSGVLSIKGSYTKAGSTPTTDLSALKKLEKENEDLKKQLAEAKKTSPAVTVKKIEEA